MAWRRSHSSLTSPASVLICGNGGDGVRDEHEHGDGGDDEGDDRDRGHLQPPPSGTGCAGRASVPCRKCSSID